MFRLIISDHFQSLRIVYKIFSINSKCESDTVLFTFITPKPVIIFPCVVQINDQHHNIKAQFGGKIWLSCNDRLYLFTWLWICEFFACFSYFHLCHVACKHAISTYMYIYRYIWCHQIVITMRTVFYNSEQQSMLDAQR